MTEEQVDIKGPGGIGFSFKGQSQLLLIVLLILGSMGGVGYYLSQHEAAAQNRSSESDKKVEENTKAVKDLTMEVKAQGKSIEAVIYVLTLPESERAKLNLSKPDKLREMQR